MGDRVCECGHQFDAHELVKGFECTPGVMIDGCDHVPDIWVCSGGRLAEVTEDVSPWDFVCGCIRHDPGPLSEHPGDPSRAALALVQNTREGEGPGAL